MSILSFLKAAYQPLNTVQISKENLIQNYTYLSQFVQIAPVLKSNAYGHGIVQVAKILDSVSIPFFCIDSIYEGYQLLQAGIKTPILIMGYIEPENLNIKKLPFSYASYTYEMLDAIKKYQPHAGVHIFVDTGMHREGVLIQDLVAFVEKTKKYKLHIEGLMSHFAMADKSANHNTTEQVKNFQKAKKILRSLNVSPQYIHIAASSGILHMKAYPKNLGNLGRSGIGLYGIDSEMKNKDLKPVLSLTSTIAQIKQLKKGEKLGYDFTFTAKKDIKIAILPIGYNDGVNRKLSNKGFVKIGKTFCQIVGRVSMNITCIDVGSIPDIKVGETVIIYSKNPEDKNSVQNSAEICGVLPYEILVQLHASTKRIIV